MTRIRGLSTGELANLLRELSKSESDGGVFGDTCTSHSRIFEWHKLFSEDREVAEDERSCRSVTSRTGDAHRFCSILITSS
ncbi:hypothetical protein TNCV_2374641 [Trichonephila clavipes]|nr:hypothetical protein TNCV_2374641 [Trichonephila clavipes]